MSRKWIVVLCLATALLIVGLFVPYFLNLDRQRARIQTQLSQTLNRTVTLKEIKLSLFPPAMESKDVRIGDDPAFRADDFIRVDTFKLHVEFWPLLHRQVHVTSLEMRGPTIWLFKNRAGQWNVSTLGTRGSSAKAPLQAASVAADSGGTAGSLDVSNLEIHNGRVVMIDQARPKESEAYDILQLSAENISTGAAFPFSLRVTTPDRKEPVEIEGEAGPIDPQNVARSPCQGTVKAKVVHFGKLRVDNFKGQFAWVRQTLQLNPLEFDLCSGHSNGSVLYDFSRGKPSVRLDGQLNKVDINEFLTEMASKKNLFYGQVNGKLVSEFAGEDRANLLRTMSGHATLDVQKGKLAQLSIGREISLVAKLAGIHFPEGETPISKMAGNFDVADNWARTTDLQISVPDMDLLCQGGFSFDDEMKFDVLATFSKDVTEKIKSQNPLSGMLNTLAANEKGQVVIPVEVSGTFEKPHFKLDNQRLMTMKTRQLSKPSNLKDTIQSIQDLFKKKHNP